MNRYIRLILLIPSIVTGNLMLKAQDPGQILLGIGPISAPFLQENPDPTLLSDILSRALARTGVAFAAHGGPNFLVHTNIVTGYLKNVDVNGIPLSAAELTFTFDIQDRQTLHSFGHLAIDIRESGETETILFRNACRQLRDKGQKFDVLISDARANILAYYRDHCQEILSEARQKLASEDYVSAIKSAGQIPVDVPCYSDASALLLEIYSAKLERECETMVAEIQTLASARKFNDAYERALLIPQNSRCSSQVEHVLDEIANATCEACLLQAETFFARNDLDRCVDALASLETVSKECGRRKQALENRMKQDLTAAARQQWEFRQQQYRDRQAREKAALEHEMSMDNRRMNQIDQKEAASAIQARYDQEFRIKKLDKDAEIRARELDIEPEVEKYRSQVAIQKSQDDRMVRIAQTREVGKIYRSYFQLAEQSTSR